ncbi:poly-beta-1,6 N-acetyl-D-glucosamine export porin PgaA [Actinobacillus pleuropneumoniae]|uniref:poly-beta-1,6 N-acetyl-D-glucosamine export porin PgaA n=1 Tax=Actinobacillus pleuropneumoniae TaxID=715 RepID=UPI003F7B7572
MRLRMLMRISGIINTIINLTKLWMYFMEIKFNSLALCLLSTTFLNTALANASPIDIKREEIVIFSRQGDSQLTQAISQLSDLYKKTGNRKVRDDLIALMMRKGEFKHAINVCADCNINHFSESELENLAKAYRNSKDFPKALQLYRKLSQKYPNNPNGLLGSSLVEVELSKYADAKKHLTQYKSKFGADNSYREASNYLLDHTEPNLSKLGRWHQQLQAEPNPELALKLYRLATKLNVLPIQSELVKRYPNLFSQKDLNWLEHGQVISSIKGDDNLKMSGLKSGYMRLTNIIDSLEQDNPLYHQAVQDRMILANKMNNKALVIKDYEILKSLNQEMPNYVQEAYADMLLKDGSPFKALEIYQKLAESEQANNKHISTALLFKLINASSDAGYFEQAQIYQDQIKESKQIWDFTRRTRLLNPNYEQAFYSQVNLHNWRGNKSKAVAVLEDRLTNLTPGDPWAMLALSDLESSRNNHDRANVLVDKASQFLGKDQALYKHQSANIALNQGNFAKAYQIIENYTAEEKESAEAVLKRYDEARRGGFTASFGISHQTAPSNKQSNEFSQEYYLNSAKTTEGHYAYVHYSEDKVPTEGEVLKQRRIGAGSYLNFFPFNLTLEAGKGIKLNEKGYVSVNSGYVLNENWKFELSGNINGSSTPIKAINQKVYTKDIGFGTTYTYRDLVQVGTGVNAMKFDDDNMRKSFYLWASSQTFQHDRWALNNGIRFDYQRNKNIASAWYYNPDKSRNIEFSTDLSYRQPMNYGLVLTHHLKGLVGKYKQQNHKAEHSWAVSYGHDWRITKKINLSYEIGRKKNIYDGAAEFNNYGNVNFSYSF